MTAILQAAQAVIQARQMELAALDLQMAAAKVRGLEASDAARGFSLRRRLGQSAASMAEPPSP